MDVSSVDHIVNGYFDVLSGKADTPRDWDRFRSLFIPDGRFINIHTMRGPHQIPAVFDLQRFTDMLKVNLAKADIEEHPIKIEIHPAGNLTQAIVTSEAHIGRSPRATRFLFTFELLKDVDRYWIVEVTSQYLPNQ
jgi:hypothetical protein